MSRLRSVVEAGVIGTPDDRLGEQVTASVVRSDNSVTADDIAAVCRDRLADYKLLREIHFVEELPKTSTRKINKVHLREEFA